MAKQKARGEIALAWIVYSRQGLKTHAVFYFYKSPHTFAAFLVEDGFQDIFMVSAETVKTRLYRALKRLSDMTENQLTLYFKLTVS